MKTINVYAASGAGLDICKDMLEAQAQINSTDFANLNITLVDTSTSNYNRNAEAFKKHNVPLVTIPNVDGFGQVRSSDNVSKILPYIGKILNENGDSEADLNIIIHSASGGSGSTLGPLMVSHLLKEDKNVLVFMVGDATTRRFAFNSRDTIKSYESISRSTNKPVNAHYFENDGTRETLVDINKDISSLIMDYRMLFGGNIHGVDSADLKNFLNYQYVTPVTPALTLANVISIPASSEVGTLSSKLNAFHDDWKVITMVTVQSMSSSKYQEVECDFRVDGTMEYQTTDKGKLNNLYFVLTDNFFFDVVDQMSKVVAAHDKKSATRVSRQIEISDADDSGLVL